MFEGYAQWPTAADLEYIETQEFDALFPPDVPLHSENDWANRRHIVKETALMIGLDSDSNNIQLICQKMLLRKPNTVAVHLFSSKWPTWDQINKSRKPSRNSKLFSRKGL